MNGGEFYHIVGDFGHHSHGTYYDWNLYFLQVAVVDKELGTAEVGKFADLVMVNENQ